MTQPSELIEFGEWLPDLGAFSNPGALTIKNCIPNKGRYKPFQEFLPFSVSLPDKCCGAFAYRDAAGNVTIFAATRTNIYKLNQTAWDDVSRVSGGSYATSVDGFFQFINYGNLIIATNYNDDIQVFDTANDTNFSQLSPTAPRCRTFFVLKDFLVCLDVADGDGATAFRVRWSPIGNPKGDWTDLNLQSDFQNIIGGDFANVSGFSIQDVGYIIQEKNIFRMEYVGGDEIFRFERVEDAKGSKFNRGAITNGRNIYYPGEDGFYEFNGVSSAPIGDGRIDDFFGKDKDPEYDYNLNASVDPINKIILWSYASKNAIEGTPDKIIVFSWVDRRFTLIEQTSQILLRYLSAGYTLEQLDDISTNIDTLPFSLDSQNWTGGNTIFGGFDNDNKIGSFEGEPKTATIETPEIRIYKAGKAVVKSVIPYIEGNASITARLGCRDDLSGSPLWSSVYNQNSFTKEFDFDKTTRYARVELTVQGAWEHAIGMSFRAEPAGDI